MADSTIYLFTDPLCFADRLSAEITANVKRAIAEDFGDGDLTALLIPDDKRCEAAVVTRTDGVLCGTAWFESCVRHFDLHAEIGWQAADADRLVSGQTICEIHGNARALLSSERVALNFLQLLSGVATQTRSFVDAVAGTAAMIVDTRKTLPGLRLAQKYAVRCGHGANHRIGLYDGILIKENHIMAAGGIAKALAQAGRIAQQASGRCRFIEIEVESVEEMLEALDAGAKMILLDNFTLSMLQEAVAVNGGRAILEASGGVGLESVTQIAETGVHRISVGELTKNVRPLDLSMRFQC